MAAINKSRDQYVDAYAAVVAVTTVALQNMPSRDDTTGLARFTGLVDSTGAPITGANPLPVTIGAGTATTGTMSSVAGSASAVTILAANAARKGATVVNDSTAILYLGLSATTPTASLYTVALQPAGTVGAYYEVPFGYEGILRGIWASATGNARVTEFT